MRFYLFLGLLGLFFSNLKAQDCEPLDSMLNQNWNLDSVVSYEFTDFGLYTNHFGTNLTIQFKSNNIAEYVESNDGELNTHFTEYKVLTDSINKRYQIEIIGKRKPFKTSKKLLLTDINHNHLMLQELDEDTINSEGYTSPKIYYFSRDCAKPNPFSGPWNMNKPPCKINTGDTLILTKQTTLPPFYYKDHDCLNQGGDSIVEYMLNEISFDSFNFSFTTKFKGLPQKRDYQSNWGSWTPQIKDQNQVLDKAKPMFIAVAENRHINSLCFNHKTISLQFNDGWKVFKYQISYQKITLTRIE